MEITVATRRISAKRLFRLVREVMPPGVPEDARISFKSSRNRRVRWRSAISGVHGIAYIAFHEATVWVPHTDGISRFRKDRGYLGVTTNNAEEALLFVTAHEMKHLTQDWSEMPAMFYTDQRERKHRQHRRERSADDWAQACLTAYRRGDLSF